MAARIAGASFFSEWSPDTTARVIPLGRVFGVRHAERVSVALHDQGRHGHGRELGEPRLLRAARRMDRERQAQHAGRPDVRGRPAGDPAAEGPSADDQRQVGQFRAVHVLGDGTPRGIDLGGRRGRLSPRDPVGLLDQGDREARTQRHLGRQDAGRGRSPRRPPRGRASSARRVHRPAGRRAPARRRAGSGRGRPRDRSCHALGTLLEGRVQVVVVLLDRAAHDGAEHGKSRPVTVSTCVTSTEPSGWGSISNSRVPEKRRSPPMLPCQQNRRSGSSSRDLGLDLRRRTAGHRQGHGQRAAEPGVTADRRHRRVPLRPALEVDQDPPHRLGTRRHRERRSEDRHADAAYEARASSSATRRLGAIIRYDASTSSAISFQSTSGSARSIARAPNGP